MISSGFMRFSLMKTVFDWYNCPVGANVWRNGNGHA